MNYPSHQSSRKKIFLQGTEALLSLFFLFFFATLVCHLLKIPPPSSALLGKLWAPTAVHSGIIAGLLAVAISFVHYTRGASTRSLVAGLLVAIVACAGILAVYIPRDVAPEGAHPSIGKITPPGCTAAVTDDQKLKLLGVWTSLGDDGQKSYYVVRILTPACNALRAYAADSPDNPDGLQVLSEPTATVPLILPKCTLKFGSPVFDIPLDQPGAQWAVSPGVPDVPNQYNCARVYFAKAELVQQSEKSVQLCYAVSVKLTAGTPRCLTVTRTK